MVEQQSSAASPRTSDVRANSPSQSVTMYYCQKRKERSSHFEISVVSVLPWSMTQFSRLLWSIFRTESKFSGGNGTDGTIFISSCMKSEPEMFFFAFCFTVLSNGRTLICLFRARWEPGNSGSVLHTCVCCAARDKTLMFCGDKFVTLCF